MIRQFSLCCTAIISITLLSGCQTTNSKEEALLTAILSLTPGVTIADVGAGTGTLVTFFSESAGPDGYVYATEVDPERLVTLDQLVEEKNLSNVEVLTSSGSRTGLPEECCDFIVMRGVYHHLTDPEGSLQDLRASLRKGGKLLVVDFSPSWVLSSSTPEGIPGNRGGHGIPQEILVEEATQQGFRVEEVVPSWPGPGSLVIDHYGVLFGVSE